MKKWIGAVLVPAAVVLAAWAGYQTGWQKGAGYFIVEDALVHADADLWAAEVLQKGNIPLALKAVESDLRSMDGELHYLVKPLPRRLAPAVFKVRAAVQSYEKMAGPRDKIRISRRKETQ